MNSANILVLAALAASLCACTTTSPSISATGTQEANPSVSEWQIAMLRTQLANLRFPQRDGTVKRLLPAQTRRKGTRIGDMFPNEAGLLAVYHHRYALSPEWDLVLQQGHYKTSSGTKFRDDGAEIVRRSDF